MAPSQTVVDTLGALGGGTWACMMMPQLYKLYKTKRAHDISLGFLILYQIGALLMCLYLYFEKAWVAWICLLVEMGLLLITMCAKLYCDYMGPCSKRAMREKAAAEAEESHLHRPSGVEVQSINGSRRGSVAGDEAPGDAERGGGPHVGMHHRNGAGGVAAGVAPSGGPEGVRQRGAYT